jgi:acyl transferase domain-containing protein
MPGAASLDDFWAKLEQGADLVGEVPPERWDWRAQGGSPAVKWGGFMDGVDWFDARFFGISPREAALMDPQQRLFLEAVWHAIEDAGHRPDNLCTGKVGLFVGVSGWDYAHLMADAKTEVGAHVSTGISHSVLANRISYLLDLKGPSEPVDTACSSSLVAIHRAAQAIRHGECAAAIAGGVHVILNPAMHQSFDKAGMLSPDGRCKTFDASADGYVRGEGVGAIVLKPLAQAEADGDHIYAVIKGSAINHGGHVSSLTVPNPKAQAEVIVEAMEQARIDPATVTYIEVHGTGTALGDPVEVEGLKSAYAALYRRWGKPVPAAPHCALGTVKTQVGHLEAAAGIAGLIKLLLSLKHRRLPGIAHFRALNPVIELQATPFEIAATPRPWPAGRDASGRPVPRRAGISSFGFGGVNAHVVLEEYAPAPVVPAAVPGPVSITLSAINPERLKASAAALLAYLEHTGSGLPALADIAFTLQAGRVAQVERLGLVVSSHDELREKLRAYLRGESVAGPHLANARAARGQVTGAEARIEALIAGHNLDELTRLWTLGADIPWERLCRNPRRVALPGYPFERVRYWFDAVEAGGDARPSAPEPVQSPVSAGAVPTGKAAGRIRLVKTAEYSPDAVFSPAAEDADKTGAVFEAAPVCHPESDKTDAVSETASVYARHTESRLQPAPELSTAPSPADTQRIRAALIQQLAKVLYLNAQDIDATTPFQELGMDSILGVEFINKLNQSLGLGLKAAELYAHPSAESLAAYLAGLAPSSAEPAPSGEKPCGSGIQPTTTGPDHGLQPTPASAETAIAIIGLSGRYPQSDDLDALWENLKAGRNCITEVPPERWDASRFYDPEKGKAGKSCSKWGGFISDVDKFDPLLFNIPPVEARTMDPQERLFLETAWQTFENAGYPRARLRKLQDEHGLGIGVFVGAMASQYSFVHPDHDTGALYSMIHHWTIANRTSYFFDLRGPSFVVDTACSSSLLALHMACESLRRGESLMALAGGVNLLLHPSKYLGLNQIGVLGSQPRSRSLGLSDGYVPGEGVGAALLKPLALAERDGDRILGVIRGSFANHGGATNGFGVPNPKAQADLIVRALRNAGVDPRTLGYVEVAANGSPVGDAIEIDALNRAFQQFTDERRFCAIGSVKANIGHLEPASGISQLTKVLLQLRHGKIVPSINAEPANPDVNLEDSPFYLPQQTGEWPRRVLRENGVDVACPRRAAINSFGIGGTNVQLIVEEYPTPALAVEDRPAATGKVRCFPLSARDPSALRRQVAGLRAYLGAAEPVPLDRLAATLQSHREPLAERLAILARTEGGLRQALDDYLAGFNDPAAYTLHTGRRELQPAADDPLAAPDLPARLEALVEAGEWERVAALWVRGANVPWPQAGTGTPLELPTYPFERRVCWFSSTDRPAIPQPALEDFQISRRGEFIRPQGNNTGRINSPLQAPPQTKTENALENLTCLVADILELEPAKLDPAEPLLSYGVDSIVLMRIRNRLKESHGFDLEPARLAELNTLRRLAEALAAAGGDTASPAPSTGLREVRLSLDGGPEASRTESEVERLIAELVGKGIALDAPGGELRLRGAESALDAATLAAVSGVKQTLARYLAGRKFQPLSACQKRYWTLSLLQTQKSAYINPMSIHLAGELDVAALELALRLAMDRNEVLRAVYPALHRQPVQVIAPVPWRGGIPMEDFSALPEAEARLRLDCLTTEESATPINPKTGPNVRLRLVRLNPSEHVLLITAHHVLFDGYAFEPFLRQVFEDYEALRQGQAPRRREITQYVEFTLEEGRRGAELSDQRGYWRAVLRDAPGITPLPLDRPRPAANSFSGDSIVRVIPARIIDALKPWLNARQASLFTGLLAVFAVAMGRWTGERRLVIGTTAQNRDRRDFEDVIGDFTNFIPLVMAMEPGASLEDLVGATKRTVEQALIHKALPFDEMIPMAPEGPANVNPIYNVHVNHLPPHRPARINDRLGAEFRNNRALNRSAMLDLRFEWFEAPDGFHVICEYNTDLFERTTIERLLGLFETTLAELAANPAAPIEAARENPAPLASRPTPVQPTQPERSPQAIMAELRTVYAELLSIDADHIGADDSFLALGGNSMLAVQLVTEIEERFVPITASDIFEHSSVRQMAGLIAERLGLARTPPPREAAPPPAEPNRQETFYRLRRLNKAG